MGLSNKGFGTFLGITGIVMFSAKAVMVKLGYRYEVDVVTLLLLRMLFSLPFFLYVSIRETRKEHTYQLTKKDLISVLGLGTVGYYLASFFDFYGLQFISASLERLILFIYPTLVILISALVLKRKATKTQIIAIAITYLGICVTFFDDLISETGRLWIGVLAIFLSALSYAVYLVGSGAMIPKMGAVKFTAYAMTISCVMVIIHYLVTNTLEVLRQPREVYVLGISRVC